MVKTRTVSDRLRSPNFRSWSMRTSLADAFAVGRLQQIQEFHLWQLNTNAPNNPYSPLPRSKKPTALERDPMLLFHANVFRASACLKHSHFLKVNELVRMPHSKVQTKSPTKSWKRARCSSLGWTSYFQQIFNYERFNRNNFNIRYWSWNYRGCWHQTCPPIDTCIAV